MVLVQVGRLEGQSGVRLQGQFCGWGHFLLPALTHNLICELQNLVGFDLP